MKSKFYYIWIGDYPELYTIWEVIEYYKTIKKEKEDLNIDRVKSCLALRT